jgi:anti-anti-sigma factor
MEIEQLPVEGSGRGYLLRGDLDLESIPALERVLFNGDARVPVVLEASELTFIDSTGLWMLLRLAHLGDEQAPGVIVRNPSQAVRRLMNIALPAGAAGMEVEFCGSGPGAAHRFTELVRSTRGLLIRVGVTQDASLRACASARRIRDESADQRRLRTPAA